LPELADELHVTQDVAHVRLNHLDPAERAVMRQALHADWMEAGRAGECLKRRQRASWLPLSMPGSVF
jgi:hypothetical protein